MIKVYSTLLEVLSKKERKQAFYVLILTVMVAFIEVLGVASIMPFMAVVANPEVIETNFILSFLFQKLGFGSTDAFVFFLGICVLVILVGSTLLKAFVVWAQVYFASLRNYSISSRVVAGYLQQPYSWFLMRNSSNLASSILEEVSRVVHGTLYPLMRLISNGLIAILLLTLLIYVDPLLAVSTLLVLGISYGLIFKFAGNRMANQGRILSESQRNRLKAVNEAFGGIKDVKITGLENTFIDKFRKPAKRLALTNVSAKLWAEMPSFAMQGLVFGGMMVIMLYLIKTRDGFNGAVPVLTLYALGAYKLMPALQEIYKQLVDIRYHQPALESIHNDMRFIGSIQTSNNDDVSSLLAVRDAIELKDLAYSYPETDKVALEIDSLKIEKNNTIGFVGGSGAGKTTAVDLILGLLRPDKGGVYVDHQKIGRNNLRAWQRNIGYVPQLIFLSDDSVAANIAFGLPPDRIDFKAVEEAARVANLHDFIVNELPEGYDTIIGERGVRLSGGQRQRIGIARALYNNPGILILDEATSALDNITEKIIMEAVRKLGHKKTIIIVAHRLSTVRMSDKLFLFKNGRITASGSYEKLIESNPEFKEMAQVQHVENMR